jgi:hypothetical protein
MAGRLALPCLHIPIGTGLRLFMSNTRHRKQNYAFVSPSFHSIDGIQFLACVDEICIKMKSRAS